MDPISITKSGKSLRIYTPDGYKTFRLKGINNSLQKIQTMSVALTEKYHSTPKFPEFLGGDTRTPVFVREDVEILNNVLTGYKEYSPETVYNAARHIKDLARNKGEFNKAFYGEVASYYGEPKFTVKQTMQALKEKKFKTPIEDVYAPRQTKERYERFVEWLYNEYRNISYRKIVNLSGAELNAIVQRMENYGTISSKYTISRYRKNEYDTYKHDAPGAMIDDPLFKPKRRKAPTAGDDE